ncbi:phosphatidylserine decarboxylase-domain-containing protein [Phlyctochytrium arcticum]|nr:phosphatidylserine decarboxylase-domain-containing protein [Phlyctochytrium arcticum]
MSMSSRTGGGHFLLPSPGRFIRTRTAAFPKSLTLSILSKAASIHSFRTSAKGPYHLLLKLPSLSSKNSLRTLYHKPQHDPHQQQQQHEEIPKQSRTWTESLRKAADAWKKTKIVWRPIPISLGIACLAAMQFIHMRRREERERAERGEELVKLEGPWHVQFYGVLPLRTLSRIWGWMNGLTVPVWLRSPLYKTYSSMFNCNLEEMEDPDLTHYPNLAAFFYRSLKPGVRPIDASAPLTSPADGKVLHFGLITTERTVEQIKGVTYSLDALLGRQAQADSKRKAASITDTAEATYQVAVKSHSEEVVADKDFAEINSINYSLDQMLGEDPAQKSDSPLAGTLSKSGHVLKPGNSLFFAVIYLAPGDYHRFHSPAKWTVDKRRHFSGELYSVSPLAVGMIRDLFVLNERVVLMGEWEHGFFSMIPVGATNVGSIKIDFDKDLRTNLAKRHMTHPPGTYNELTYAPNVVLQKGDQMGGFELGSTVVLVFEAPNDFSFQMEAGQTVRMGERIGEIANR